MDLSELTIKLIMLLIPGAVCTIIIERLTVHKPWTTFKFLLNVILTGSLTYLIYQLLISIPFWTSGHIGEPPVLEVWKTLTDKQIIPYSEILWGSLISVFLGFITSAFIQYKILNKLARFLRLTDKYGDENLYSFFLNSPITDEVYLRDKETGLTYHGLVDSFSEDEKHKEIVLTDVTVYYSETSQKLYDIEKIYLCKSGDNLVIELPFKNQSN